MKAAVYTAYGAPEVLALAELDKPVPGEHDLLLRVKATAVNSGDVRLRKADPFAVRFFFGLLKPRRPVLGAVFSGEVEAVGKEVKMFKVGDPVFGHTDMRFGAHAEYLCLPEHGSVALKPAALTHQEAAVIPFGGITALHFIRKARIQPHARVLVIGASGAVGSAAVQLAKFYGARVTGVCSTANMQWVQSIGARHVVDYTREDYTQSGERYDVIFDAVNTLPVPRAMRMLAKNGTLILSAAGAWQMFQALYFSMWGRKKILTGVVSHRAEDIVFLKGLTEAGKFKPVIDRTFSLAQIAGAHAYVEQGHKKGNVAILV